MVRSKRVSKLLMKFKGQEGSVFDINGGLIGRGKITYKKQGQNRLYLDNQTIPLKSIRNLVPNFNGSTSLVFIDANYGLSGETR